jgi:hypothetical protein
MTITIHLVGGLGNQMFQYAFGTALAQHYQTNLAFDDSWYGRLPAGDTSRQMDLRGLKISNTQFITPQKEAFSFVKSMRLKKLLQSFLPSGPVIHREKNGFVFDSSVFALNSAKTQNHFFIGYWQAFNYIDTIRAQLQSEFQPRTGLNQHYQYYRSLMQSSPAAMVHVRRGDYVHLPAAAQFHGVLSLNYYLAGMRLILEREPNTHFFLFSDDLPWCKENFPQEFKITYIERNEAADSAAQEIDLMTYCKHFIIANSSFSWWGAWLRKNVDGLVIAPNRWIADTTLDLSDLLPANWKSLPA